MLKFSDNIFDNSYYSTIGVDFRFRIIDYNGKAVKFQIWDLSGQERFRPIIRSYFIGSHGFIITFSLADRDSFNGLMNWLNEIHEFGKPFIIVGTKSDLESQRVVTYDEAKEFAERNKACYIEISNATGYGVTNAFKLIASEIMSSLS